jgi:dipeptidyl aminopeptidase/acylaminoacyl peptidase
MKQKADFRLLRGYPQILKWIAIALVLFFSVPGFAVERERVKKANYKLASRFTTEKMKKLVFSTTVEPVWLIHSDRFWYSYETPEGKTFYLVDPAKKSRKAIFDNNKIAAQLTRQTKDPYDAKHLPIKNLKFTGNDRAVQFEVESSQYEEAKPEKKKDKEKKEEIAKKDEKKEKEKKKEEGEDKPGQKKKKKKKFYFEYDLTTGKLTLLKDFKAPPKKPEWASISPDKTTVVFARHHNLYMMDKKNYEKVLADEKAKDIEEIQLTGDGEKYYSYASSRSDKTDDEREKNKDKRKRTRILWSKDSKKIALVRDDERKVKDLWVIHSAANPRPKLETYKYPMPGEKDMPQQEIIILDLKNKTRVEVKADRFKDQTLRISWGRSKKRTYENSERLRRGGNLWLADTSDTLYFERVSRDMHRVDICAADTGTGEVRVLLEERLNTYIETNNLGLVDNGRELIHWSERDGWAHFYLFSGKGKLKRQLTSGPFHCDRIMGIDEKNRVLYFTACGREEGEDPYYMHLYRVNLDGGGLKRLTPKNNDHEIRMIDNGKYFVDNFSRVDTAPQSALRDNRGNVLFNLEKAELSRLFEAGFKYPETFKVKADDGITDIYGVMYKPFDFDETKCYPIIAYVYPGPQTEAVPKAFSTSRTHTMALSQFGFIVIAVGNRGGHPNRSKWYHNYGYGNLRDYGLADKKAAIEQLAARHPFIDIDRVGIYGHSGGGFMSTAAMLVYPDFFKVAVSSAGNHENNVYNKWWSEKHHGIQEVKDEKGKITFKYDIERNSELAKNLKGRLLITHGDVDNNVHIANTLRLAEALIKANKRFDMFIFPGQRHGFGNMTEYFFWQRADYFCKHLIGDYRTNVDMVELNLEQEQTGKKRR